MTNPEFSLSTAARDTDRQAEPILESHNIPTFVFAGSIFAIGAIGIAGLAISESNQNQVETQAEMLAAEAPYNELAIETIIAGPDSADDIIGIYKPEQSVYGTMINNASRAGHEYDFTSPAESAALHNSIEQFEARYEANDRFILFTDDYNNDGKADLFIKTVNAEDNDTDQ